MPRLAVDGAIQKLKVSLRPSAAPACARPALAATALAALLLAPVPAAAMPSASRQAEAGAVREERARARQEARQAREEERAARLQARSEARHGAAAGCQLSLEPPAAVVGAGDDVALGGKLTCPQSALAAAQQVTLLQHEAGTPGFHAVASATCDADGAFQLMLEGLQANSAFYVRAAGARSERVRVGVAPVVTLQASASSAAQPARTSPPRRGGASASSVLSAVTFSGTVTPARAGATVVLQRQIAGARRWRRLGRTTLSPQGTYTFTRSFRRAGKVDVRVVVHHPGTVAATSPTVSYMTAPRQNPALTIDASANPLTFGQPLTITGTLAGGASRPVTLWARIPAGKFTKVAETVTDAQGSYVFSAGAPLQTTCYRVDAGKVRSIVMRARVAYQIALSTPPVSGLAGAPLTISGTVVPMPAGGVVYVERGSASGLGFHRVGAATVGADGSFSLAHAFFGAGSATLRVAVPGDEERDGTVSDPFTVQLTRGGAEAPPA